MAAKIVARNYDEGRVLRYVLYEADASGARLVDAKTIEPSEHAAWLAEARANGVRIGGCFRANEHVWVFDDAGYAIWRAGDVIAGDRAGLSGVTRVEAVIGDDYIERGVRVQRADGATTLVSESNVHAEMDPSYTESDLQMSDARWCSYCARDLARWLGCAFVDFVDQPLVDGP